MRLKRILSILLAVAMVAVMTVGVCAAEPASTAADKSGIQIVRTASDDATKKDETVYVMLDGDGTVQRIIVSDWLKNPGGETSLGDYTDLSDVSCVKGEAECLAPAEDGVELMAILDALYESARTGHEVVLR